MVGSSHCQQVDQNFLDTRTRITHHLVHDFFSSVRIGIELKLDGQLVHTLENNLEREVVLGFIRRQYNNFRLHSEERILDRLLSRVSSTAKNMLIVSISRLWEVGVNGVEVEKQRIGFTVRALGRYSG